MSETEDQFVPALKEHAPQFDLELSGSVIEDLRKFYDIVQSWSARLHLVAPCSPEEFAIRHVLESLLAIKYINANAHVVDIGSGGGLPIIPCIIARPDIRATLIESSPRKAVFLREALRVTDTSERAEVISERFEKTALTDAAVVTCRALDRFQAMFSKIFAWSPSSSTLLLFGGTALRTEIERQGLPYTTLKIPESDRRFIFIIRK